MELNPWVVYNVYCNLLLRLPQVPDYRPRAPRCARAARGRSPPPRTATPSTSTPWSASAPTPWSPSWTDHDHPPPVAPTVICLQVSSPDLKSLLCSKVYLIHGCLCNCFENLSIHGRVFWWFFFALSKHKILSLLPETRSSLLCELFILWRRMFMLMYDGGLVFCLLMYIWRKTTLIHSWESLQQTSY